MKRLPPEERLRRAAMILRHIEAFGQRASVIGGNIVLLDALGPGRPLLEQLRRHYRAEAVACLDAAAAIARLDRV